MLKILVNSLFFLQNIHCTYLINQIIYQNTLISLDNSANLDIFLLMFLFLLLSLYYTYTY